MVEHHLAAYAYLRQWEARVERGKKSPTTLREIHRYARPGGHFDFWRGRSVSGISYGDVEDFQLWLAGRISPRTKGSISSKTQKDVSDAFRTFLRWLKKRDVIDRVPEFPRIDVPEHEPKILDRDQQEAVLKAIPWERRGAFLVAATEALRLSEIRALNIDDYAEGKLMVDKAIKGPRVDSPVGGTKNHSAQRRELWSPDLVEWIQWRLKQANPQARLRGEIALFWNPTARNTAKRWTPDALERQWNAACESVGVRVPFQQGTRHSTLTRLAQVLPERVLRDFSRHRDGKSLDHYAKPKATPEAIVKALRRDK
jgi:integrase